MLFREMYYDGCNGWRRGDLVEHEVNTEKGNPEFDEDDAMYVEIDGERWYSRNDDYIFEDDEGSNQLIPCED